MPPPLMTTIATLAVSAIYIFWEHYHQILERRQRLLRSRVAFMLWVMANRDE